MSRFPLAGDFRDVVASLKVTGMTNLPIARPEKEDINPSGKARLNK